MEEQEQEQHQLDHRDQRGYEGITDCNRGFKRQDTYTDTPWYTHQCTNKILTNKEILGQQQEDK